MLTCRGPQEAWYVAAVLGRLACLLSTTLLVSAAARADEPPARPAPLAELDAAPEGARSFDATPTGRHVDIGSSFVFVSPIANSLEREPSKVHYDPGVGVAVSGRIVLLPYLHAAAVFSWAAHTVDTDRTALGVTGGLVSGPLTAYRLEAHALPTLPLGERVRLFAILGLGWGRLEVGAMRAADAGGVFVVRGRGASYFDVPAGLGGSVELLKGWLSLDGMFWAAPTFAKEGTAHTPIQAYDSAGKAVNIGPLPEVPVWFVQSVGLSLLL